LLAPQINLTQRPPARACSGVNKLFERVPAESPGAAHFNNQTQAGLAAGQGHQRSQFGAGQNLTFEDPQHDRCITVEQGTQLRHDALHLADGSATANTLMAEVRRPHAMQLQQVGLWVAEATG
jgi:hypothetical protein